MSLVLTTCSHNTAEKEIEIQGRYLTSRNPPFALTLPSEFELIHHISLDYPKENSRTRTCLYIKKKEDRAEEILIVQIADRTNPESEPITTPPLKPQTEKRMYLNGQEKKEKIEVNYLIQLIGWNPDAPSLQPIRRKGSPSYPTGQSRVKSFLSTRESMLFPSDIQGMPMPLGLKFLRQETNGTGTPFREVRRKYMICFRKVLWK